MIKMATFFRSSIPPSADCNSSTNLDVSKPSDFSCLPGIGGGELLSSESDITLH